MPAPRISDSAQKEIILNTSSIAKLPPQNIEAEQSLLGALLIDKEAIINVAESLHPTHFYRTEQHGQIYRAILELFEKREPVDLITVTERLKANGVLEKVGGTAYLTDLINKVPTSAHVEFYARIIKEHATRRNLIASSTRFVEEGYDESIDVNQVIENCEQSIFALSQQHIKRDFIPIKDALAQSFDRLDELQKSSGKLRGVPTGFRDLDNKLAGLQDSNLIIFAARPGVGKTSFILNVAAHITVNNGLPVGFFSLEMSQEELVDRLLVSQADIDAWKLKTGKLDDKDFDRLSHAMGQLADAPLYIDDTPGATLSEIRTKARRLQMEHGLKMVVIDYLQLININTFADNRVQQVSEISKGLKNLARELKVPVFALSQLSRAVEARGSRKPQLADLRESGCITGDSLIMRADTGELIPIKDLLHQSMPIPVYSLDSDWKLRVFPMVKVFSSGNKKIYRLKLRSGREVRASGNHKFRTLTEWKRLDTLIVGERIAIPRFLSKTMPADYPVEDEKLIVLAHMIGDGCYLTHQPVHYTSGSRANIEAVEVAAQIAFGIVPKLVQQENWYHLYLTNKGGVNMLIRWFKDLGIFNNHSFQKKIPQFVFQLSPRQVALFLSHLWSTDGNLSTGLNDRVAIYYASSSKTLASQVQHLLLRIGIMSRIRVSKKTGYRDMYHVIINGKNEQLRFLEIVGVFNRDHLIDKAKSILENLSENPNLDVIPQAVWQVIEQTRKENHLSGRAFQEKMAWSYSGTQRFHNGVSRVRLGKIAEVLESKPLSDLAQSEVYWDEIAEIGLEGEEEVFDATVEGAHNFMANDVIVHNSIEQDADVVMFIYREDPENLEDVTLDIQKHRNGPTGEIKLIFRGDRVKFYGMERHRAMPKPSVKAETKPAQAA